MKKLMMMTAVAAVAATGWAMIEPGAPFTDGAILQRGMKVPVWGKATAGNKVKVAFADNEAKAIVGEDGKWRVNLPAMEASKESRELVIVESENGWLFDKEVNRVTVKDVLVGEVWFACGQSNTECPIWHDGNSRYRDGKGAMMIAMTRLPYVRCVKTPRVYGSKVRNPLKAKWLSFEPENFEAAWNSEHWKLLSAMAWYYARELYLALDIPIGIIDSSIGGTNIDAWTPQSGYEGCPKELEKTANWKICLGDNAKDFKAEGPVGGHIQQPTVLFNGMVWDYAPMAMRGLIWYQGCHNHFEADLYAAKLRALYKGWTKEFENDSLKFYIAQLAPWKTSWLKLCMAQTEFAESEPNAAVSVLTDVGNFDDIHPNDKETVAQRLALHALKRDYGFKIDEDDSPVAKKVEFKDGKAVITFDHVKTWYVYNRDMSLNTPFEIAGKDGVWHDAKLVDYGDKFEPWQTLGLIDRPTLTLECAEVKEPLAVRYMGKDKTSGVMYNQASLPLGPFEIK